MRFHIGVLAAAFALLGCESDGFGFLRSAPQSVQVARNSITIAGPAGYCIDRSAIRDTQDGAFVLLGSCASLANDATQASPRITGALTASVSNKSGAEVSSSLRRLGAFFRSDQGRMALARDGNGSSVTVLSARRSKDVFILKLRDVSPNNVSDLAPVYWRALFDIRGHIVTLSVHAFFNHPMRNSEGMAILNEFVARVRRENPALVDQAVDPV
ncbi:MAG: hypothetical protein V3V25_01280 [Paracoccaceae bacterium]